MSNTEIGIRLIIDFAINSILEFWPKLFCHRFYFD